MVRITLRDNDLNVDAFVMETAVITVVNTVTEESEQVTLTETDTDTGVFEGTVATTFGSVAGVSNDGILNVRIGDSLRVIYFDALTDTGDTATVADSSIVMTQREVSLFVLNGSGEIYRVGENEPIVNLALSGNSAQKMSISPSGNGYLILDRFGRITSFGDAEVNFTGEFYGIDIARDVEQTPSGNGVYVLHSLGSIQGFGDAPLFGFPFFETIWRPFQFAVDLELTSSGNGYYILDHDGAVYPYGDAVSFGHVELELEIARDIELMPDGKGYLILDAFGFVHGLGSGSLVAESLQRYSTPIGLAQNDSHHYQCLACDLEIYRNNSTDTVDGWWILDIHGNITPVGLAPAPIVRHPTGEVFTYRDLEIHPSKQ